jgi:hypothetical protein
VEVEKSIRKVSAPLQQKGFLPAVLESSTCDAAADQEPWVTVLFIGIAQDFDGKFKRLE